MLISCLFVSTYIHGSRDTALANRIRLARTPHTFSLGDALLLRHNLFGVFIDFTLVSFLTLVYAAELVNKLNIVFTNQHAAFAGFLDHILTTKVLWVASRTYLHRYPPPHSLYFMRILYLLNLSTRFQSGGSPTNAKNNKIFNKLLGLNKVSYFLGIVKNY